MCSPESPLPFDPSSFVKDELAKALSEQAFGITSFELVGSTKLEATARAVLLEGTTITVSLSARGFTLGSMSNEEGAAEISSFPATSGQTFESLDHLLEAASPLYVHAKQKALMDKLAKLAANE